MTRTLLKSKLHRVRLTSCALDYVGSIGIDEKLMEIADIIPYEKVLVVDVTNGARFETYAIPTPPDSGEISVYGAAAHLVNPNDILIIFSFAQYDEQEAKSAVPTLVFVDNNNRLLSVKKGL